MNHKISTLLHSNSLEIIYVELLQYIKDNLTKIIKEQLVQVLDGYKIKSLSNTEDITLFEDDQFIIELQPRGREHSDIDYITTIPSCLIL